MKPSSKARGTHDEDCDKEESDATPTRTPLRPLASDHPLSSRPSLVRAPPQRLSEIHRSPGDDDEKHAHVKSVGPGPDEVRKQSDKNGSDGKRPTTTLAGSGSSEDVKLAKLRDAVNAKMVLQQRRGSSPSMPGVKRVSPIAEETGQMSPSLTVAFASPSEPTSRPLSTMSTDSTDSTRTIRVGPSSDSKPLRTPSYPFPVVSTPRKWSFTAVHQPFTNLSPTVGAPPAAERDISRKRSLEGASGQTTPGAITGEYMTSTATFQILEDPNFPTPNLYSMILQLNTEPGIEQWWATVTNLMHDTFKAERVSLAMPMDPTDIENVPWGQKATFSMNGREEFVPHRTVLEQVSKGTQATAVRSDSTNKDPWTDTRHDVQMQKLHPERLRPRLESRHSYAGNGRDRENVTQSTNPGRARPQGPQRFATHAPGMTAGENATRIQPQRTSTSSTLRHHSLSDPEFSSIGAGPDSGPYAEVFQAARALGLEINPLIEPGGVIRVLERGRVVTVTRDYVSDDSDSSNENRSIPARSESGSSNASQNETRKSAAETIFGNYRSVLGSENYTVGQRSYEEYEQYPSSPWAQSPAPSPAMQADEDVNPFFANEEERVEDSFKDTMSPNDYSQYGQVEAIGVDRSSTIIHIPLIHPTLSQPIHFLKSQPLSQDIPGHLGRSNTGDVERRAPIAILSVLSPAVPYPPNLTQSLNLLGPHLATSFAIAQQFSAAHHQPITIRHRRTASGNHALNAPMTIEPMSLDDLLKADFPENPGSVSADSITSPSDYSGRSRQSPSGSIVETPGWDPASHGWISSKSVAGTPFSAGSEIIDNYFDAKKRSIKRNSLGTGSTTLNAPARANPSKSPTLLERKTSGGKQDAVSRNELNPKTRGTGKDDGSSTLPASVSSTGNATAQTSGPNSAHRRTLHSKGANFESSFGMFGNVTSETSQTHTRKSSYPEDMPPPSERLLRTIIDSVPVQIFTAKPDTGELSWVNSKFLIYRGLEPKQVLSDPWHAIHPDERSEFLSTWHRSLRTSQQLQQKVRLQRFDGSFRWFYVRAAPLKDKRQKIVHWIGTMMDFHEQHLAEMNASRQQETAASEAKYRTLANSSPQIVFAVTKNRGVTFCNSQWVHYSGQPEAQALGVGFMDHVHPDDLSKCKLPTFHDASSKPTNVPTSVSSDPQRPTKSPTWSPATTSETDGSFASSITPIPQRKRSQTSSTPMPQRKLSELATTGILKVTRDADGRPSYSTEVRLKSREGEYRWHLVRVLLAEPMLHESTEEETWYGTCTDINDHKTLERDLKETMDEKSRFLSNMSHEIRTPLNGITGMVNFLIDSSLSAEQMEHVNIIRASTEGLRGLINDILDLSKAEAGMIQLNMDWLYVRALLEEVNDLTSAMAIDKGLELNYLVEEDVPTQIKGDRFRLRQILLNIVGNAIKFTQKGEVFVRCSTRPNDDDISSHERYIRFEVIDTGSGFTEKEAEYLFKRFSQIDGSSTRQHGGTGLGLVISRQLAQLHGGDMSAQGKPGEGSTFSFFIKAALPSEDDQPPTELPMPPSSSATQSLPLLPSRSRSSASSLSSGARLTKTLSGASSFDNTLRPSPKILSEMTQSPLYVPDMARNSPANSSSASSDPSVRSAAHTSSARSERSSTSSFVPEPPAYMNLSIPEDRKSPRSEESVSISSTQSKQTDMANHPESQADKVTSPKGVVLMPPMYSILVVCPLKYSREATVEHIDKILPKTIPHQITARANLLESQRLLGGADPVIFTHVVVVLQNVDDITALMDQVLSSPAQATTSVVIITDLAQRRKIMEQAPNHDYHALGSERRVRFVFKPLKPSRFAIIFDPQKEREMSTDRNQNSAQQVAVNQKQVFDELTLRLGDKGKRVLLVEDNRVNQMVILKFLSKVSIDVETALDGVQCTDKVFARPPGYYSIILCDLHMPNKDGYQTCKEIRKWEHSNHHANQPIIALSANVLGDVYQKCVEAGFNSYMTKPVDFKELSTVLMSFMDPSEPNKPHEFMKLKRGQIPASTVEKRKH
ncbi:Hypothetical protein R9X50_00332700 [Acrodontium crateriforme]|uniref:histidine kinase n=1 Tax=Acrodontium crateriforme TaxID=150365 RepID=A0AAQ3M3D6_9PEZI|nr:Hypothetical protein R9X50_00332700 [Acrodontium crateriforme]